jgi:hydrogenase-4 component F
MVWNLIIFPLGMAAVVFAVPSNRWRPWLLPLASLGQLALVVVALQLGGTGVTPVIPPRGHWLVLDPLGKILLALITLLFLMCTFYTAGYLTRERDHPNRVFCTCLLLSLSMMTLVILSHHLGLMWVAMEATTLTMAPNLYFHRNPRSLEATWKYLLICSVGIALALLGSFFLAYATVPAGLESTLLFDDLVRQAPHLSRPWLHAAFVLLFVGYGTKMGLAPMHTWLPDAHGEAPAPVSALLSGALLPCAFLAILRIYHICIGAGDPVFARRIMMAIGLLSMAVAAAFMVRQRDFKRLLAYSSVEHMGILVVGMAIGGWATFATLLHIINNGLTKAGLFLSAGNIQSAFGSKLTGEVSGALRRLPLSGGLFLAGFLAITGSPPFGLFVSEFSILTAAFDTGQYWAGGLYLLLLLAVFLAMGVIILEVVLGNPPPPVSREGREESEGEAVTEAAFRDRFWSVAPILALLGLVLMLGLYIPPPLKDLLQQAAAYLEAGQ